MRAETLPPAPLAWTVWGLGAALYIIGFFQRNPVTHTVCVTGSWSQA
jgi:hypothetical protein